MGYCALKGKPIPQGSARSRCAIKQASVLGRKASKLCKQKGLNIVKLNEPRFGEINSYPELILNHLFR